MVWQRKNSSISVGMKRKMLELMISCDPVEDWKYCALIPLIRRPVYSWTVVTSFLFRAILNRTILFNKFIVDYCCYRSGGDCASIVNIEKRSEYCWGEVGRSYVLYVKTRSDRSRVSPFLELLVGIVSKKIGKVFLLEPQFHKR